MSPSQIQSRITAIVTAWSNLRPTKSFYGMTLEQFKATVQPSLDSRSAVADAKNNHVAATVQRDTADTASLTAVLNVVKAIVADPAEGDNGELYKAMGYTRKSERASGLTQKAHALAAQTNAAVAKAA